MAIFEEISSFDNVWVPDEVITSWASRDPSPVNNQVVVFIPIDGVRWQLMYDSLTDKWPFIGGGFMEERNNSTVAHTATSYTAVSGSGNPSITSPASGRYFYQIEHEGSHSGGWCITGIDSDNNGSTMDDLDGYFGVTRSGSGEGSHSHSGRCDSVAGDPFRFTAYVSGNTMTFYRKGLNIQPVYLDN